MIAMLSLAGCTTHDDTQSEVDPAGGGTDSTQATDTEGPAPDNGGGGASVSLPSAPVGGQSTQPGDDPAFQCLSVNWLAGDDATIPAGATVSLGDFTFDPAVFDIESSGCESDGPLCTGFTFTSDAQSCSLPVRWNGTAWDPDVFEASADVDATAACEDDSSDCAAFLEAVQTQSPAQLGVTLPPPDDATS